MGNRFIPGQEQQTWAERFRPELTEEDLRNDYARYQNMLREEAKRIMQSSEARKYIIQNLLTADPYDLLSKACECIYDMTGDTYFERHTREMIEKIKTEKKDGTTKKTEEG